MFKLKSPEEREKSRKQLEAKFAAEDQRIKLMIYKIEDQIARGYITNEFIENFIFNIKSRIQIGLSLTDKQLAKLEEIFERN